jgi:hypothetical protein
MERDTSLAEIVFEYRQREFKSAQRQALMETHARKATIAGVVMFGAMIVSPVAGVFILPEVIRQAYLMESHSY